MGFLSTTRAAAITCWGPPLLLLAIREMGRYGNRKKKLAKAKKGLYFDILKAKLTANDPYPSKFKTVFVPIFISFRSGAATALCLQKGGRLSGHKRRNLRGELGAGVVKGELVSLEVISHLLPGLAAPGHGWKDVLRSPFEDGAAKGKSA